jgi:predicted component of type VI protein secretion system
MPYLILADKNQEIDRRELTEAVTIGRSLECGLQVRDALLSRQHCRIEPIGSTWVLTDLNSRNGTFLNSERITQHVFEEGDVVRMGRVRICFRAGPFVAAPQQTTYSKMMRPSDPVEALSGTVMGFVLTEVDMEEESRISGFPIPQPQPAEPAAYKRDEVATMVAQIASRSWDAAAKSGETRKVVRPLPQPMVKTHSGNGAARAPVAKPVHSVQKVAAPKTPKKTDTFEKIVNASATTTIENDPTPVTKRPLHRAGVWIAIGAAAAIYIVAMYVIIQA